MISSLSGLFVRKSSSYIIILTNIHLESVLKVRNLREVRGGSVNLGKKLGSIVL